MNKPIFDTRVQELKYKVLREISKSLFNDSLLKDYPLIPKIIVPGPKPTMRCCIYKERAIVNERIELALGGNREKENVVEVIKIACDECPLGGYEVTRNCRGCIAHRCEMACKKDAISFDPVTHQAKIDKTKCVNCGMCAKACQYGAIQDYKRPCENACKVNAISMDQDFASEIDDSKCISCGACVSACPFGAIMDVSYISDAIKMLKDSENSTKYHVYAIVAPSISSQFKYMSLGQVITAIKLLGFHSVVEAALGADMVAYKEAKELEEKGFLTTSCCPAFKEYITKQFPTLKEHISSNLSPMAEIGKYIKSVDPTSKTIFIGPCIAKKKEIQNENVKNCIDTVLTFEELQAMIDAKGIDYKELSESSLDNASYYGRIFARSGGVSDAVVEALKEQGSSFIVNGIQASGLDACKQALLLKKSGVDKTHNFIEGMACASGCIGGPCCLTHEIRDKSSVDKYGKEAKEKTILDAIKILE